MKKKLPMAPVRAKVRGTWAVQAISMVTLPPDAIGCASGTDITVSALALSSTGESSGCVAERSEAATGVGEQMADVGLAMQRAVDKTENMRARANAVEELEAAGTFDDLTALGSGKDDIDRQLEQLSTSSQVDDELAKMKAELGGGSAAAPQIEQGTGGAPS